MFPNRFAESCGACRVRVQPNEGYAFRDASRAWRVVCKSARCAEQLGLKSANGASAVADVTTRSLERDPQDAALLIVRMPFDRDSLPLQRALPGSRWDGDRNVRTCSAAPADLPRVIELARKLGLAIPADLEQAAATGTQEEQHAAGRADTAGLYSFQREGVRFLARRTRALLADDMGCGKTPQALCALPETGRTLVVCPAVVKYNWAAEAARWRPDLRVTVLSGKGSFRLPEPGEIVVINYDLLPKAPPKPKKGQRREPLRCGWHSDCAEQGGVFAEACAKRELADVTLVVDEAHLVKNRDAQRTRAVQAIGALCARVWFLTGTPLANRAMDLFGVLAAGGMEREVMGGWMGFIRLFNGHQNRWGGWEFGQPEPEVPERLRRVMLRRTKEEVLPDLPPITYQEIQVNDLPRDLQRDLDEAWADYCEDDAAPSYLPPFEEFSRLRARLAAARIPALTELVEQYEETETPLLVFSAHRAPIDTIAQREGWAAITGDTEAEERTEIVARFQRGELKGVALTIKAGGVGITLTRASTAVFVDLEWRPIDNWQAEDRMRRIGQLSDKITVVRMSSRHPMDLHVQGLIAEKIKLIRNAVENTIAYQAKAGPEWREESAEEQAARVRQAQDEAERIEREQAESDRQRERGARQDQIARRLEREEHVELTVEQQAAVRGAFGYLCSVCDGAETEDLSGFNKADQGIRRWLETVGLDDGQAMQLAYHVVRRYPRQVKEQFPQLWEAR
jgi:SWI/SNF-related matrix-associated actin-dependent regulator 1 of chromatin subfamily A